MERRQWLIFLMIEHLTSMQPDELRRKLELCPCCERMLPWLLTVRFLPRVVGGASQIDHLLPAQSRLLSRNEVHLEHLQHSEKFDQ